MSVLPARPEPPTRIRQVPLASLDGRKFLPNEVGEVWASEADGGVMSFIAATHDPSGPNGPPPHFVGRKISPPLELLVHPDLDGVRLEKPGRRLALLLAARAPA